MLAVMFGHDAEDAHPILGQRAAEHIEAGGQDMAPAVQFAGKEIEAKAWVATT